MMNEFATTVLQYVPAFRRFACGHTGGIQAADILVLAALKRLQVKWLFLKQEKPKLDGFGIIHRLIEGGIKGVPAKISLDRIPETDAEIANALRSLPATDRSIVLLASVELLAFEEIAHVLRVPVSFVIGELPYARERVRQVVESPLRSRPHKGAHLRRVV